MNNNLLQEAIKLSSLAKSRNKFKEPDNEILELIQAYLEGNIKLVSLEEVLKLKKSTAYSFVTATLMKALRSGKIILTLNK